MLNTVTETGRADDLIDALMSRTHGNVLAPPSSANRAGEGGEYDPIVNGNVSRRDVRRLVMAGLYRRGGMEADRLAAECDWQGNADDFVTWYCCQALAGLDDRADHRNGCAFTERERDEWDSFENDDATAASEPRHSLIRPAGDELALPEPLSAYISRLVHAPKKQYAAAVTLALVAGEPIPPCGAPWATNVIRRVQRYMRSA